MTLLHDVPLFPLGTVLFPGGKLPLRIFEQRYMDMAKACLKNDTVFGVCLIASGRETGAPASPHEVGTLARIKNWDMQQFGVLQVQCHGEQRFRILSRHTEKSGLHRADIEATEVTNPEALSSRHAFLAELFSRVIDHIEDPTPLQPYYLDDATWVGYRLGELLPMNNSLRQKLLEQDDVVVRLDMVRQFLHDKGMLNGSDQDV